MDPKARGKRILTALTALHGIERRVPSPDAPFRALIGALLSQRTRDEKTDAATAALLGVYPTPAELVRAPLDHVETLIRPVNFYKTKATRVLEICRILNERHNGVMPNSTTELMRLPGVGAKTAACVRVFGFDKTAVAVDTHVHRVANRLGLARSASPVQTEKQLWETIPRSGLKDVNYLFIRHGKTLCKPHRPLCGECPLNTDCDYAANAESK